MSISQTPFACKLIRVRHQAKTGLPRLESETDSSPHGLASVSVGQMESSWQSDTKTMAVFKQPYLHLHRRIQFRRMLMWSIVGPTHSARASWLCGEGQGIVDFSAASRVRVDIAEIRTCRGLPAWLDTCTLVELNRGKAEAVVLVLCTSAGMALLCRCLCGWRGRNAGTEHPTRSACSTPPPKLEALAVGSF